MPRKMGLFLFHLGLFPSGFSPVPQETYIQRSLYVGPTKKKGKKTMGRVSSEKKKNTLNTGKGGAKCKCFLFLGKKPRTHLNSNTQLSGIRESRGKQLAHNWRQESSRIIPFSLMVYLLGWRSRLGFWLGSNNGPTGPAFGHDGHLHGLTSTNASFCQ